MYEVKLEQFQGPLDLLLRLCQEEKLEINKISLAKIADSYLLEINERGGAIAPSELADFLLVAAQLLLIKSKLLLPWVEGGDEEEEALELEQRLIAYRQYIELSNHLKELLRGHKFMYSREGLPKGAESLAPGALFVAKGEITKEIFESILKDLLKTLEQVTVRLPKEAIKRVMTLEAKIKALKEIINLRSSISFKELTNGSSKLETVVSFLAMLQLMKDRYLEVSQDELWGEMKLQKLTPEYGQP